MRDDGKQPGERLNWMDRTIGYFNPMYACRAMAARQHLHLFGYNDHPERRGSSGGQLKNGGSESWAKSRDAMKAMWDARDLAQYDWIGGVLGGIALYVVGELECKSNTGDDESDALYDEYFHGWCGDAPDEDDSIICDYTGRHRLLKLLQMAFVAMLVDGDHGFVLVDDEGKLRLQSIEGDRIGSPLEAFQTENYIRGFTIDPETGRVLSIRVFKRTRTNQYVDPVEIDPASFIHLWDPTRCDQYRGVTALLPILDSAQDIREWDEAEMIAGKTQSQWAALMGTKNPYADKAATSWSGQTTAGTPTQDAIWGKILKMAEGETFSMLAPPNRPSGAFQAFIATKLRKIAKSLGFSYEFIWDMSQLGGAVTRVLVRSDERRIMYYQRLLVDRILRRLRNRVLSFGVAYDGLPPHPKMNECFWHFGERIIVDAGYEVQNDLAMLQAGLMDPDTVATKYNRGGNLREIARRRATIVQFLQNLATTTRVPIEMLAGGLWPNATELLAAANTPPDQANPPPPPPGSLQAVGEKGAAQIVDLLVKVASGEIDPESAGQTLVTVYGLDPIQAQQILPKPNPHHSDNKDAHENET